MEVEERNFIKDLVSIVRYERDNDERGKKTQVMESGKKNRGGRGEGRPGNIFRGGGGNHRRVRVIKGESNQEWCARVFTIREIARETSKEVMIIEGGS